MQSRGEYKIMMERDELAEVLFRADRKIYSCGCPYLALSDELGYITAWAVRNDPILGLSNFGRLSVKKMLRTAGFSTNYGQFIYECLENGDTLEEIGRKLD